MKNTLFYIAFIIMADIKMAAMASRGHFWDGSISDNVCGRKLYKCTGFHTFMKMFKKIPTKPSDYLTTSLS